MPRPVLLSLCLAGLGACGLGQDWERWQRISESHTAGTTAGASSEEVSGSPADASSSTSTTSEGEGTTRSTGGTTESVEGTTTEGATTGSTSGALGVCGDGVVEGDEECDDPGDTRCFKCHRDRVVFVTSKGYQPDWGMSPVSLDFYCNQHAYKAGLLSNMQWRFKAWISTSQESAADRLYHSPGRYVLVNGLVFAESWEDIVAGNLLNPLNVTEESTTLNAGVWTGTGPDGVGVVPEDGDQCVDWSESSFGRWVYYGFSSMLDAQWTMYPDPAPCLGDAALYCFESP